MQKKFFKYSLLVIVFTYTILILNHYISAKKENNMSIKHSSNKISVNAIYNELEKGKNSVNIISGTCFSTSMSKDGKKILFSSGDNIFEMNIDGSSKIQLTNMGHCYNPVYNYDCSSVYFARNDGIYLLNIKTKEIKKIIGSSEKERSFSNPNVTPEGDLIYFSGKVITEEDGHTLIQKEAGIYILRQGKTQNQKITNGYTPVLSKDGRKLAYELDGKIYVYNMETSETKYIDTGKYVSWSQSGNFISYSKYQKESKPYTKIKGVKNLYIDKEYSNIWIANVNNNGEKRKAVKEQFEENNEAIDNWAKKVKESGSEQHFLVGSQYAYLDSAWTKDDNELFVTVYSSFKGFGLIKIQL